MHIYRKRYPKLSQHGSITRPAKSRWFFYDDIGLFIGVIIAADQATAVQTANRTLSKRWQSVVQVTK